MRHPAKLLLFIAALLAGCGVDQPVPNLAALNGCYRGEGLPSFMRPKGAWTMRVQDGVVFDQAGNQVSKMTLADRGRVTFNPGVKLLENEQKHQIIVPGPDVSAPVFMQAGVPKIVIGDFEFGKMERTDCS